MATRTLRRPWPSSVVSRSAPPKAGSRRPAPADCSRRGAGDAPDNGPGRPAGAYRTAVAAERTAAHGVSRPASALVEVEAAERSRLHLDCRYDRGGRID